MSDLQTLLQWASGMRILMLAAWCWSAMGCIFVVAVCAEKFFVGD